MEYERRVLVMVRLSDFVPRCRERIKEILPKKFGSCSPVRFKEREQIHLGIGELNLKGIGLCLVGTKEAFK